MKAPFLFLFICYANGFEDLSLNSHVFPTEDEVTVHHFTSNPRKSGTGLYERARIAIGGDPMYAQEYPNTLDMKKSGTIMNQKIISRLVTTTSRSNSRQYTAFPTVMMKDAVMPVADSPYFPAGYKVALLRSQSKMRFDPSSRRYRRSPRKIPVSVAKSSEEVDDSVEPKKKRSILRTKDRSDEYNKSPQKKHQAFYHGSDLEKMEDKYDEEEPEIKDPRNDIRSSEMYKTSERNDKKYSDLYKNNDRNDKRSSEMFKNNDRNDKRSSEMFKNNDRNDKHSSETFKNNDRNDKRSSEMYKNNDRNDKRSSEMFKNNDRNDKRSSEMYKNNDRNDKRPSEMDKYDKLSKPGDNLKSEESRERGKRGREKESKRERDVDDDRKSKKGSFQGKPSIEYEKEAEPDKNYKKDSREDSKNYLKSKKTGYQSDRMRSEETPRQKHEKARLASKERDPEREPNVERERDDRMSTEEKRVKKHKRSRKKHHKKSRSERSSRKSKGDKGKDKIDKAVINIQVENAEKVEKDVSVDKGVKVEKGVKVDKGLKPEKGVKVEKVVKVGKVAKDEKSEKVENGAKGDKAFKKTNRRKSYRSNKRYYDSSYENFRRHYYSFPRRAKREIYGFEYGKPYKIGETRRLIAATTARIEDFPYMASIQKYGEHWCSGAILNQRMVITTANCVWRSIDASRMKVRVGSRHATDGGQIADIQEVAKHPGWSLRQKVPDYDIALLLVSRAFKFCDTVHSVDLPNKNMYPAFDDAFIASYGVERRDGVADELHPTLQSYRAELIPRDDCSDITRRFNVTVTNNFICFKQRGRRAPCTRDTGAPAVSDGVVWGLASWSIRKKCGTERFPAVFSYTGSIDNIHFLINATMRLMSDKRLPTYYDNLGTLDPQGKRHPIGK